MPTILSIGIAESMSALCWTFLLSLKYSFIGVLLASLVLLLGKKSSSSLRYWSLYIIFFTFNMVALYVFIHSLQKAGDYTQLLQSSFSNNYIVRSFPLINEFFYTYGIQLLTVWLLIFLFKCSRILSAAKGVAQISSCSSKVEDLTQQVSKYAKLLGISRQVFIHASQKIFSPVAIGVFRPMILLPIGFASHLPMHQVEMAILHELAHIKRNDYLLNLIQCFSEAIFFFNIPLLWLSKRIRQEREACCDDIVMAHFSDKREYIESLLSFGENAAKQYHRITVNMISERGLFTKRIFRILQGENFALRKSDLIPILLSIIMAVFSLQYQNYSNSRSSIFPDENTGASTTSLNKNQQMSYYAPHVDVETLKKKSEENYFKGQPGAINYTMHNKTASAKKEKNQPVGKDKNTFKLKDQNDLIEAQEELVLIQLKLKEQQEGFEHKSYLINN